MWNPFNFLKRKRYKIVSNRFNSPGSTEGCKQGRCVNILLVKVGFGPWEARYGQHCGVTIGGNFFTESGWYKINPPEIVTRQELKDCDSVEICQFSNAEEFVEKNFVDLL